MPRKKRPTAKNGRPHAVVPADHPSEVPAHGNGRLLRGGVKGNAGGGESHKKFMLRILHDPKARAAFKAVAEDASNAQGVIAAQRFAREVVYGKAKQEVEHTGTVMQQAVILLPMIEMTS